MKLSISDFPVSIESFISAIIIIIIIFIIIIIIIIIIFIIIIIIIIIKSFEKMILWSQRSYKNVI